MEINKRKKKHCYDEEEFQSCLVISLTNRKIRTKASQNVFLSVAHVL